MEIPNVMLCERGIRTYEKATRNTLDISAVPILKHETHLPVFVDITHSTGRKDILITNCESSFSGWCRWDYGRSSSRSSMLPYLMQHQQMSLEEFDEFFKNLLN